MLVKEALGDCEVGGIRLVDAKITGRLDFHPRIAMQILRHSKIGLTMEIYTEVPSAAIRDALKRLGRWLGSCALLPHFAAAPRSKKLVS